MNIFVVQGDHPSIPGHIMKFYATRALANIEAANIVNLLLNDYTDDEDDSPIIAADATAETWEAKCLEYRQHVADDMDVDLDHLDNDDAGDVWITEEPLHGVATITMIDPSATLGVAVGIVTKLDAIGVQDNGGMTIGKTSS